MITSLEYKGKTITLDRKDDRDADIVIEGRVFPCINHGDKFDMWMCPGAFYHPPELSSLAKHLVDYWYILTDPNTAPPSDDHGMPMPPHGGGGEHGGGGHGGHDVQEQPVPREGEPCEACARQESSHEEEDDRQAAACEEVFEEVIRAIRG